MYSPIRSIAAFVSFNVNTIAAFLTISWIEYQHAPAYKTRLIVLFSGFHPCFHFDRSLQIMD